MALWSSPAIRGRAFAGAGADIQSAPKCAGSPCRPDQFNLSRVNEAGIRRKSIRLLLTLGPALIGGPAVAKDRPSYPVDPKLYQALQWRNIGPFRGGRTTAVAGRADQPATFYLGASGGGVWKTTDAGVTWRTGLHGNVQDYVSIPSRLLSVPVLSLISAVEQDPPVTRAAREQARALEGRWSEIKADMNAIKEGELAAFNARLREADVPHDIVPSGTDSVPPPRVTVHGN